MFCDAKFIFHNCRSDSIFDIIVDKTCLSLLFHLSNRSSRSIWPSMDVGQGIQIVRRFSSSTIIAPAFQLPLLSSLRRSINDYALRARSQRDELVVHHSSQGEDVTIVQESDELATSSQPDRGDRRRRYALQGE